MLCNSIESVERRVNVRQVLSLDTLPASNQGMPDNDQARIALAQSPLGTSPLNTLEYCDTSATLKTLVTLFTSFFTQLISLFSDKKDSAIPVVPPNPEVSPAVTPMPAPPRPRVPTDLLGLSGKRDGAKPGDIWGGFRQGPDGNCVTVSAIKAAMYKFGQSPMDVFKEVSRIDGAYRVMMRDDFMLTLTDRELAIGAQGSKFIGHDTGMVKDAQFLFAVSAKRAQMENNDGTAGRSFEAAVRSLNDGEDERGPGEGFLRLGLRKHMRQVSVRELAKGQLGMCNRAGHSVAVINGREELWGRRGAAPTRGDAIALV